MRVLVVSPTFPPMRSGGADHALRLCQQLAARNLEVHVLTSRIDDVATDPRLTIYPVMRHWSWGEMPRLVGIALRCRPDVVNLQFTGGIFADEPMVTFAPTFLKKILPEIRFVTQIEYPEPVSAQRLSLYVRLCRKLASYLAGSEEVDYGYGTLLRDSDQIVILSEIHRSILARHFCGIDAKCVLIPPPPLMRMADQPIDEARRRGREMLHVPAADFLIAYFGYLYPGKGIETLLSALQLVTKTKTQVRLVLIGDANEVVLGRLARPNYLPELRQLTRSLGLDGNVVWSGYYPTDSDVASVYLKAADACVLPFDDGVMLNRSSFAGAVAHGLPTITTRGEILENPFKDGENVLLHKPMDPASLAAAIERLMNDRDLRMRLSSGALSLAREWFSWERAIDRTLETFKSPAKKKSYEGRYLRWFVRQ